MLATITPQVQRPPRFDGTCRSGTPSMLRVLPTRVVAPEIWTPLPASEPARLLAAAQRSNVQRLRLCLSLGATLGPEQHPDLVTVELQATVDSDSDPFFMLAGTWYQEQAVLQDGVASCEALAAKAEALSALVNEVTEQRVAVDDGKGRLHVVLLTCASAGAPGRLVLLRAHAGSDGVPPQVQIALAVPLSAPAEQVIREKVQQQIVEMSRIASRLMSGWGIRQSPVDWSAPLSARYQHHAETCVLALGLPRLELAAVRELGVEKEGELRMLDHSSKTWQDRLVVLRQNFLLSFQSNGASDRPPSSVLRIDPESDVIDGFGDARACPLYKSVRRITYEFVDPTGEQQTVLSAADAQSRLVWMEALQFNCRVVSAPWRSDRHSYGHTVVDPARATTHELSGGSNANHRVVGEKMIEEANVVGLTASATRSSNLASANQPQATQFTDEHVSQDSAMAIVPVTNAELSTAQQASAESVLVEHSLDHTIDPKKIEALREMVGTKLRHACTDMMKGAAKKPSGPDPSAAALVLGQNFLSRAEEQVAALRQTVGPDCLMQTDWINYVLGAAYPELEQFLGWVQASYLDNLQDSGLRRLARVANLRTDAFLASLRDHEKPKMEFNQLAHLPTGEVLPEKDVGNKANGGVVDTVVVTQHVPINDAADSHSSAPKLDPLLQQGKIKDAVSACAQVQGCTTTTAACNFLLKRCSKEMLGEAAASAVFAYLEQTAGAVPDVTTYSHFIENLCLAKNVARAMATLTQMRARGVTPRDEDFAAVVSLCIGLADFSKGIQVVRQAIEAGAMPALELLNALISTTKTTEETTTAFQAISTAGHEPNKRSYQQLVEASCVCGDSSLAVRALRQMAKRGMVPTEELVTRAVERCATVNVRHCLKILEMCAADSLPLPAKEGVLYFLQMCCKNGSSQLSASAVQDCLTAMHSVGFTIDPDLKDAFRTLRRHLSNSAAELQAETLSAEPNDSGNPNARTALDEYVLRSES